MNPTRDDERLKELLTEAFPAGEPSQELRERIASRAYTRRLPPLRHRTQVARLIVVTLIAIACGIGLFNWNRWVAAEPLRRMQAALAKVETIYHKYHWTKEAKEMTAATDTEEGWEDVKTGWMRNIRRKRGQDGALQTVREELIRDEKQWIYDPTHNEVMQQKYHRSPFAQRTGFTVPAIRHDLMKSTGGDVSLKDRGRTTKDSRPARHFSLVQQDPGALVRIELYVDPNTDLPFYGELYALRRGEDQWQLHASLEMVYNAALPPDTFAVNFPRTATWRDLERERKEWSSLLEKGIVRKTTESGREIVIRHFHVGPEGDVTVLYTDSKRPAEWLDRQMTLTDDQGTRYQSYTNTLMGTTHNGKEVFPNTMYGGFGLEGEGWVATTPQPKPWQARTFTIAFRFEPPNQGNMDGKRAASVETLTFSLPVGNASTEDFPAFLSQLPWSDDRKSLAKARARARGELEPDVTPSPERIAVLSGVHDTVQALEFSPDGRTLVSAAWKDSIRLWDVATGKQTGSWDTGITGVSSLTFTKEGHYLALSGMMSDGRKYTENRIQLRQFPTGNQLWQQRIVGEDYGSTDIGFSPDGSQLHGLGVYIDRHGYKNGHKFTADMSSRFWAWDIRTGKQLDLRKGAITTPDSNRPFVEVRTGEEVILPPLEPNIRLERVGFSDRIALSNDGTRIAAIGTERQGKYTVGPVLLVWDAATGKRLHTFRQNGLASMFKVTFSPNGSYIAGTNDRNIMVWNLRTGRLQTNLVGHGRPVMELAFSPDGSLLASGDLGGGIMLWRMPQPR